MRWRNAFPVQGGWQCRHSWSRRDCRRGAYGRGMPRSRRRMSSRHAAILGPGDLARPRCWYRDVLEAEKEAEVSWLRARVMGPDQRVWALRITAKDRYSDRCWCWGEREQIPTIVPGLPLGKISAVNRSP